MLWSLFAEITTEPDDRNHSSDNCTKDLQKGAEVLLHFLETFGIVANNNSHCTNGLCSFDEPGFNLPHGHSIDRHQFIAPSDSMQFSRRSLDNVAY